MRLLRSPRQVIRRSLRKDYVVWVSAVSNVPFLNITSRPFLISPPRLLKTSMKIYQNQFYKGREVSGLCPFGTISATTWSTCKIGLLPAIALSTLTTLFSFLPFLKPSCLFYWPEKKTVLEFALLGLLENRRSCLELATWHAHSQWANIVHLWCLKSYHA